MKKLTHNYQSGFTIVELMIATMVFSTILLVITYGVLSFTKSYYKGVNSSTTQQTALNIMDTISQAIQLSGSQVVTTDGHGGNYFCAGNKVFIFAPGVQYTGTGSSDSPGLYAVNQDGTCTSSGAMYDGSDGGKQLLGSHMRIASLQVTNPIGNLYKVNLRLVYSSGGDPAHEGDDLLTPGISGDNVSCKSQIGSQFCAVSALNTTIRQRVPPN